MHESKSPKTHEDEKAEGIVTFFIAAWYNRGERRVEVAPSGLRRREASEAHVQERGRDEEDRERRRL